MCYRYLRMWLLYSKLILFNKGLLTVVYSWWMNIHRWRMTITLGYKIITLFILSLSPSFCGVRETERGRQMKIGTLTHNFFSSSPYHAVLSLRDHLALLLLGQTISNLRPSMGCCPSKAPSHLLALPWLQAETDWRLTLTDSPYLTLASAYMIL